MKFILLLLFVTNLYAQENKTSYDFFVSNSGKIITKEFYLMKPLKSKYKTITIKLIKLLSNDSSYFFISFSVIKNKTVVVSYNDLKNIYKAIQILTLKAKQERNRITEYKETYFIINRKFKVGYFQKGLNQTYFISLYRNIYVFNSFKPLNIMINNIQIKKQKM